MNSARHTTGCGLIEFCDGFDSSPVFLRIIWDISHILKRVFPLLFYSFLEAKIARSFAFLGSHIDSFTRLEKLGSIGANRVSSSPVVRIVFLPHDYKNPNRVHVAIARTSKRASLIYLILLSTLSLVSLIPLLAGRLPPMSNPSCKKISY